MTQRFLDGPHTNTYERAANIRHHEADGTAVSQFCAAGELVRLIAELFPPPFGCAPRSYRLRSLDR